MANEKPDRETRFLARIGAISGLLGTLVAVFAFGFSYYAWKADRQVRLEVDVSEAYPSFIDDPSAADCTYDVTIRNQSDFAVSVGEGVSLVGETFGMAGTPGSNSTPSESEASLVDQGVRIEPHSAKSRVIEFDRGDFPEGQRVRVFIDEVSSNQTFASEPFTHRDCEPVSP